MEHDHAHSFEISVIFVLVSRGRGKSKSSCIVALLCPSRVHQLSRGSLSPLPTDFIAVSPTDKGSHIPTYFLISTEFCLL